MSMLTTGRKKNDALNTLNLRVYGIRHTYIHTYIHSYIHIYIYTYIHS